MKNIYSKLFTASVAALGIFIISWSIATAWTNPSLAPVGVTGGISVSPSGNVGIGTASPTQKLDVAGNVRWSGSLTGGSVSWSNLSDLPFCPGQTFLFTVGDTSVCLSASWSGLTGIPAGFADGIDNTGTVVTSVTAGAGILTTPAPITTTGSIAADTNYAQRRVTGTCPGGAISGVNADGTVTCKTLPTPLPCTWGAKTFASGAICHSGGIRSQCVGTPAYDSYWLFICNANGTWSYHPGGVTVSNNCTRPAPVPQCNF